MDELIGLVKLLILMASNFGYYNFLRKHTHLNISSIPMATIGIQISILFIAGLLNLLLLTAIAMLAGGIIFLALDFYHKKIGEYGDFASVSYAFAGACLITIFFLLRGTRFFLFDDFSHWAVAVQELMIRNAYPDKSSWIILFPTYPLGSTIYIYYCCLVMGLEESAQMLAQSFMMICAIMPLFSRIHKHKICALFFVLAFTNFVLVYNVKITGLQVDTLLPLFSMGTLLAAWDIYNSACRHGEWNRSSEILIIAPLLITIVLIKQTGLFFAIPTMILVLNIWKYTKQNKGKCAAVILAPTAAMLLWRLHCKYVFPDSDVSKHAVSIDNYMRNISEKSTENILEIGKDILAYVVRDYAIWYVFLLILGVLLLHRLLWKSEEKQWLKLALFSFFGYFLYIGGLYITYVVSMPAEEAAILSEIDRYIKTMDIAVIYLITAYCLQKIDGIQPGKKYVVAFSGMLIILLGFWSGLTKCQMIPGPETADKYMRAEIDERIENYNIPAGSVCVIVNSNDLYDYYYMNLMKYLLYSKNIYLSNLFSESTVQHLSNYQYVVMMDYEDDMINQWIQKNFPDQYGNDVIVTYE